MFKKHTFHLLIFLLLLGFTSQSFAQQYNFIHYSLQEGLPQSQVFASIQDSKGFAWFGTQGGGVSRFDGVEFDNFSTRAGLPSNYVGAILEDNQGRIWVGTTRGLCYLDGRKFTVIGGDEDADLNIHSLVQMTDSTLWVGSGKGIYEYSFVQNSLKKLKIDSKLDYLGINAFFMVESGIWVASNSGVWHIGDDTKRYTTRDGLAGNVVQSFLKDSTGLLWMASFDGGLSRFDEKAGKFLPFDNIAAAKKALVLFMGEGGSIWVGTRDKGIAIYQTQDSTWMTIGEKEGLPHNHVRTIFRDSWNNIWIGTSGGGMAKYIGQFFVHYRMANGLHGKYIYALENGQDGQIWVSASSNGLASFDGNNFQELQQDSGYINVKSKTVLALHDDLWIGTEGKGVVKVDGAGYRVFTQREGLPSNWIRSLVADENDDIWVATYRQGLAKIRLIDSVRYQVTPIGRKEGLLDLYITAMSKSPDGRIWFATQFQKLGFIEQGKVSTVYQKKDGLPGVSIRSITFDTHGNIWLGTAGKGIYFASLQADSIRFQPLKTDKSLYSDNIYLLLFDPAGNLWAGSENGVDEISFNEAGIVVDVQHYGRNEGFLGIETCQNSALVDSDGNLWFGTMNGLMKHIPTQKIQTLSAPKIHFKNISLFYKPLVETDYKAYAHPNGGLKDGLELPYRQNHLSFEFKALNLSNPKDIRFKWRLVGMESDWSPYAKKESVDYSRLPPGIYTFEVQAVSGDDNFSEVISAQFLIKKPFWQLLWVQLVAGLLFLSLLLGLIWNGKRKIERREAIKREKLEMENHVLQLEQKALQLQMNPHFIFNALNSIQSLVATKDFTGARSQINNFATLMRGILSNSKQQKITLSEEINVLRQYLQMEQFCQRIPFEFKISYEENVDIDEIEIPPMILQPFVENSVIHGISHLQKSGLVEVVFSLDEEILSCTITDNGVGRKKAAGLRQKSKPGHQSIAMDVTRQRLEALKGERNFVPLEIKDITTADGRVEGTEIIVRIWVGVKF